MIRGLGRDEVTTQRETQTGHLAASVAKTGHWVTDSKAGCEGPQLREGWGQ